jgi:hypothetical protein
MLLGIFDLTRGVAEWSIAAVLKTVEPRGSGGSNPSSSAKERPFREAEGLFAFYEAKLAWAS